MDMKSELKKRLEEELRLTDTALAEGKTAIYGAGNTSALYEACFHAEGIDPEYYIDNDPVKRGTLFQGKPVITHAQAREKCQGFTILISSGTFSGCESILRRLREEPIRDAAFLTVDEAVFGRHAGEILEVFDWLEDDLSRETYVNMVLTRMHRERQRYELTVPDQYYGVPEFTFISNRETFVDCGAYVGDSVEQYLNAKAGTFDQIYAFEPDRRNFEAMSFRVERLCREWAIDPRKITLINAGVGEKRNLLSMRNESGDSASLGAGFSMDENSSRGGVRVLPLDEVFADRNTSFLKADIESYEYAMLLGAEKVIRRDRPKIAICIYHNPSDMFRIAHKLRQLVGEYRLAVRQHRNEMCETVLYAWC